MSPLALFPVDPSATPGAPDVGKELKLTDAQRMRFMATVQELERKIQPLIKEAQERGNPEEVRPKALKVRKEYEATFREQNADLISKVPPP